MRNLGKPKKIILHCSDSEWGTVEIIRKWHVEERGWDDVGYHFIILNGALRPKLTVLSMDGQIQVARDLQYQGAHTKGHNDSIGICLIGVKWFTDAQIASAKKLILDLAEQYPSIKEVKGHCDYDDNKTCPNFDVLRTVLVG